MWSTALTRCESHTMTTRVGTKGQVVIEKALRDELGVKPGWLTEQRRVGADRVEIRFFPGEHDRSLRGVLAGAIARTLPADDFEEARRRAWSEAAMRRQTEDG